MKTSRTRNLGYALGFLSCACLAAEKKPLTPGVRVNVEGRIQPDGRLYAKEIQIVGPDRSFEIAGPVRNLNKQGRTFSLLDREILITKETAFENVERKPLRFEDLMEGGHVKVKARTLEEDRIQARSIRIYDGPRGASFEFEAPVTTLDPETGVIQILGFDVRTDRRTLMPGNETASYLDFEDLGRARGIRRDDDAQQRAPIRIGRAYLGGQVTYDHETSRDLEVDEDERDRKDRMRPSIQTELSVPLGEFGEFYTRVNLNRRMEFANMNRDPDQTEFLVQEMFLYVGNFLHPSLGLQVGRQRFRDKREWLIDDQLDAVRLHVFRPNFRLEFAAAKTFINPNTTRGDQYHYLASMQARLPGKRYFGSYIFKRNDVSPRDEDPIWIGLNSRGDLARGLVRDLEYWTEFSFMRGREKSNLLRGHAFDAGLLYRLALPLEPTISAGYAYGTGDSDLSDGIDGNFRQTQLQDNSHRFNGIRRYRYYGVLMEPELNNIKIATADVGIRRGNDWSLNVTFHHYRQVVPFRGLGDGQLEGRPSGRDPRLGKEIDFVFAFRRIKGFDIALFTGFFLPGPAFRDAPGPALFFRPQIRYYF
jgi:hypothetical protein